MEYISISTSYWEQLCRLHAAYKAEIGEDAPTGSDLESLRRAVDAEKILFFGCVDDNGKLAAICSVCVTYSTFNYAKAGVFEDFYILPEHRHKGIARGLVRFAYERSGISSMTVGAADCDVDMYKALGFNIPLGNMLAYEA